MTLKQVPKELENFKLLGDRMNTGMVTQQATITGLLVEIKQLTTEHVNQKPVSDLEQYLWIKDVIVSQMEISSWNNLQPVKTNRGTDLKIV